MLKRVKGVDRKTASFCLKRAPLIEDLDDECLNEYMQQHPEDKEMAKQFPAYVKKQNKALVL